METAEDNNDEAKNNSPKTEYTLEIGSPFATEDDAQTSETTTGLTGLKKFSLGEVLQGINKEQESGEAAKYKQEAGEDKSQESFTKINLYEPNERKKDNLGNGPENQDDEKPTIIMHLSLKKVLEAQQDADERSEKAALKAKRRKSKGEKTPEMSKENEFWTDLKQSAHALQTIVQEKIKKGHICWLLFIATLTIMVLLTAGYILLCLTGIVCTRGSEVCSLPKNVENGRLLNMNTGEPPTEDGFVPYHTLVYVCNNGFTLFPDTSTTSCKKDGTWTLGNAPTCNRRYRKCDQTEHLNPTESGAIEQYSSRSGINVNVYCDYISDGGGWIVILRRSNGEIDFFRDLVDYERGFGIMSSEFWFGLQKISTLTQGEKFEMRVDLEDFDGEQRFASYTSFSVGPGPLYRLTVGGYRGDAGDSMKVSNGMSFSARDLDRDISPVANCAAKFKGGWWYQACFEANLLGQYLGGPHDSYGNGINWRGWRGYHYSLKRAEMKIRPL